MIRFQAFGISFTLPLLTLLFPFLALHLGLQGDVTGLLAALGVHELAHVAAAKWQGVQIQEIRLMPFGGSARMENPYGVPARRMLPVAAAGPAANLLLALLFSALVQWKLLPGHRFAGFVQHNLVLCLFNLLPALPLDGGRMLFAMLHRRIGEDRALQTGIWLGRLLAAGLLLTAFLGGLLHQKWNLSFILAAVFVLSCAHDERTALYKSRAQRLSRRLEDDSILPVRIYQAGEKITATEALSVLRPKERSWFCIAHEGKTVMLSEERILAHILQNGAADAPLAELVGLMPGLQSAAPRP